MCGRNARMPRTTPSRLMLKDHSQSAMGISSSAPRSTTPALFIRISTCPMMLRAVALRRSTSASWETSQCTARAHRPSAAMAARVSSRRKSLISAMTTSVPRRAMASAVPLPIPLAPPVMTATFPANCIARSPVSLLRRYRRQYVTGQQFQCLEVRLVVVLKDHPLHPLVRQRLELHDELVRRADQPAFRPEYIGHGLRVVRCQVRDKLLHDYRTLAQ